MIANTRLTQIKDFLDPAQSVLVLIPPQAKLDIVAASSALSAALEASGKQVVFATPQFSQKSYPQLNGLEKLQTEINNKNLIVSFEYQETAFEKVNYHIGEETHRFYLTIEPKPGFPPLDKDSLEVSYAGAQADLVFLIGVTEYKILDQFYIGNEQFFQDTTVISLNNFESSMGDIKIETTQDLNMSSAVAEMIKALGLGLPADAATNLLFSIEKTADNFRSFATTPELLETAAWLMRQGARRVKRVEKEEKCEKDTQVAATLIKPISRIAKIKKAVKPVVKPVKNKV